MSEANNDCESSTPKKVKLSNDNNHIQEERKINLHDFIPDKVLSSNTNRKTVCLLGKFRNKSEPALVILEKSAFQSEELNEKGYFSAETILKTLFENDIYGNYECFSRSDLNAIKANIIYPATEKHIEKFSQKEVHILLETPELYENITLPYIEKEQFNLQWVYNILEGKSEQERIIYNNKCKDNGFVLLPDLKWDGKTKETLYLLAIVRRRDIKSLRDLNENHLTLLKTIRDEGKKAILERYNVPGSQLRIYFHYQPSFYHLHVHFTYLKHEAPGITTEKSHLLDTVIDNIEMVSNYYQRASIPFVLTEIGGLFEMYESKNILRKVTKCEENLNPIIDK